MTRKILVVILCWVATAAAWILATVACLKSENQIVYALGVWLGYWTATRLLFYVVVAITASFTAIRILGAASKGSSAHQK